MPARLPGGTGQETPLPLNFCHTNNNLWYTKRQKRAKFRKETGNSHPKAGTTHCLYGGMNMDAKECIRTRRSVRKYTDKPVTEETIRELIELASYAPSWKNCQPIRYTAVFDQELQQKIADTCVMDFPGNKSIIEGCSVLLIPTIRHGRSGFERDGSFSTKKEDRWEVFDAGIAAQTVTLAAHAMGLGTVIMGIFDPDLVAEAVGLPEDQIVATLIGIGYPDQDPKMPPRKSVDDLLTIK